MDEVSTATGTAVIDTAKKKRRKKKKYIRRAITVFIILLVAAGIAYGIYWLFREDEGDKELWTDFVTRGSIQSTVIGGGLTKAQDSATITLSAGGTVLDVYVREGDTVHPGDPLYTIDSAEALLAVEAARKTVDNYEKQLGALNESYQHLTVKADFAGVLTDTADLSVGDYVSAGMRLGTLVDDSKMRLVVYFNYAYEHEIHKGQAASVSIPSTMTELQGTVTEIDYIKKVTPEGAQLFRVVVTVNNPGVLTADMGATAVLTASDGEAMYPYEAGVLAYNRSADIVAKASGNARTLNLLDYRQVSAGAVLAQLDGEDNDEQAAALESQLQTAREALDKALENLENFDAVSPMTGTVLACTLIPGERVESGRVAVTIADTSVMTVEAQIDEMNVTYVKPGMYVTISVWGRYGQESFMGVIESVSLEGKSETGFSYFPAIIRVDNPDGRLMSGMYVDYSLVASQSDDCLLAPVQAVKYTDSGACLFIRADARPDNALDAESLMVEIPEGFYAVPVTVGLSDNSFAEIIDGVEEGTEVFVQYMTNDGNSFSGGMYFRG